MEFIDLNKQYHMLKNDIDDSIQKVLEHSRFILGPEVSELEKALSGYVETEYCISCASGSDALQILFMAYDIHTDDIVFCPDVTFVASIEPAIFLGARPVFCDIDTNSFNICPKSLVRQIESVLAQGLYRPKAVVAVDLLGNPADYDELKAICKTYGLLLIQDAAQSFGAEYKGLKSGNMGHAAITSFFPAKPLGCYGDGGAIFTNDLQIADTCKSIRTHGSVPGKKYYHERLGINSRLDTIQAAILLAKLRAFQKFERAQRNAVAQKYNHAFADTYQLQTVSEQAFSVYAQYVLLLRDEAQRNIMLDHLNVCGVPTSVYYPQPLHEMPIFHKYTQYSESFVNALQYCQRTVSVPMHPYLEPADQDYIIRSVLGARS